MKQPEGFVAYQDVYERSLEAGLSVDEVLDGVMRETGLPVEKYEFVKDERWCGWWIRKDASQAVDLGDRVMDLE